MSLDATAAVSPTQTIRRVIHRPISSPTNQLTRSQNGTPTTNKLLTPTRAVSAATTKSSPTAISASTSSSPSSHHHSRSNSNSLHSPLSHSLSTSSLIAPLTTVSRSPYKSNYSPYAPTANELAILKPPTEPSGRWTLQGRVKEEKRTKKEQDQPIQEETNEEKEAKLAQLKQQHELAQSAKNTAVQSSSYVSSLLERIENLDPKSTNGTFSANHLLASLQSSSSRPTSSAGPPPAHATHLYPQLLIQAVAASQPQVIPSRVVEPTLSESVSMPTFSTPGEMELSQQQSNSSKYLTRPAPIEVSLDATPFFHRTASGQGWNDQFGIHSQKGILKKFSDLFGDPPPLPGTAEFVRWKREQKYGRRGQSPHKSKDLTSPLQLTSPDDQSNRLSNHFNHHPQRHHPNSDPPSPTFEHQAEEEKQQQPTFLTALPTHPSRASLTRPSFARLNSSSSSSKSESLTLHSRSSLAKQLLDSTAAATEQPTPSSPALQQQQQKDQRQLLANITSAAALALSKVAPPNSNLEPVHAPYWDLNPMIEKQLQPYVGTFSSSQATYHLQSTPTSSNATNTKLLFTSHRGSATAASADEAAQGWRKLTQKVEKDLVANSLLTNKWYLGSFTGDDNEDGIDCRLHLGSLVPGNSAGLSCGQFMPKSQQTPRIETALISVAACLPGANRKEYSSTDELLALSTAQPDTRPIPSPGLFHPRTTSDRTTNLAFVPVTSSGSPPPPQSILVMTQEEISTLPLLSSTTLEQLTPSEGVFVENHDLPLPQLVPAVAAVVGTMVADGALDSHNHERMTRQVLSAMIGPVNTKETDQPASSDELDRSSSQVDRPFSPDLDASLTLAESSREPSMVLPTHRRISNWSDEYDAAVQIQAAYRGHRLRKQRAAVSTPPASSNLQPSEPNTTLTPVTQHESNEPADDYATDEFEQPTESTPDN